MLAISTSSFLLPGHPLFFLAQSYYCMINTAVYNTKNTAVNNIINIACTSNETTFIILLFTTLPCLHRTGFTAANARTYSLLLAYYCVPILTLAPTLKLSSTEWVYL